MLQNIADWNPVAGDVVEYDGLICRIKSVDRRKKMVNLFVPDGNDDDGDIQYNVETCTWDDIKFVSGHR